MFPADFDYQAPKTLPEALALLAGTADARVMAGGHSLLPLMKLRLAQPATVIDITHIPGLSGVREDGDSIVIGATTTHYQLESSELLRRRCAVVAEAAALIGDPAVRNRGTIGGSLAHADPGADLPAVMLALGAQLVATSATGSRTIAADDFFTDMYATALGPDEVLTEIRIPSASRAAYLKFPNPASRFAIVGVAVANQRVALTGAGSSATRLNGVEQALQSGASAQDAAAHAAEGWEPFSDLYASAEYRQHLARVFAGRALEAAAARG